MNMPPPEKSSASPALSREEKPVSPESAAEQSPDPWKLVQNWVWRRFGWFGPIALACLAIWWQWDHVSKLPGIEFLVARISERPLPKANPQRFNIAVVHL